MTADNAGEGASKTTDIIGCSVRGQKSVEADIPCQDDNEQRRLTGQRYVIAAADGLGTASLSHVGSGVATQAVAEYVEQALAGTDALDESRLQSVLQEAFAHVREQLDREANSRGVAVSELNTTLLVAVGGPAGVGGAAVGDGGIVWHRGGQTGLLIPREDTEYGNETIPVQSDSWQDSYRFGWMPDADAAAAFSDGLDGVAWDGPMSVSDELFDQVFDNVAEFSNLDKLERFLTDFLDGETLRESSRDDKTLVIGALPTARWSDPEETDPQGSLRTQGYGTRDTGHSSTGPGLDSGSQADSGSRRRTGRRRRERSLETTTVDERLGGGRTRLVVGAGGIAAVILVVLAGVLLLLTGGGGGAAELNLSTAELRGDEGLLVKGSLGDGAFNGSRNLTVRLKPDNESLVARHNGTQVTNGQFEFSLEPEQLENTTAELYSGEYKATVSSEDDAASANVTVLAPAEFAVEIVSATTPVAGENLMLNVSVENVGDLAADRTVELDVGSIGTESEKVTLSGDNSTILNLSVATGADDAGSYTANVGVADGDSESAEVTVKEDTEDGERESPHEPCLRGTGQTKCSDLFAVSTGGYLFAQVTGTLDQHGPSRGGGAR